MAQKSWTLFLDESGRFDATETGALVVGGVLCPGARPDLGRALFRQLCDGVRAPWPPHATELQVNVRDRLLAGATDAVTEAGGQWLFVASRPARNARNAIAAYVEMLGAIVDLAARTVALAEGRELSVIPAQRTVPMMNAEDANRAGRLGLGREDGAFRKGDAVPFRAWVEGEVRQVFDALAREDHGLLPPFPDLAEVEVVPAYASGVDTGIIYADLGCNALYRALSVAAAAMSVPKVLIAVDRNELFLLRRIDRCIRDTPPDLHGAGRALAMLESRASAIGTGALPLAGAGAAPLARRLLEQELEIIASEGTHRQVEALAQTLAGSAFAALSAKSGAYEGTWTALTSGWAGDTRLSRRVRAEVRDRDLAARLWRCTMECANHRGDVQTAYAARSAFVNICEAGHSLALIAEALAVNNFEAVMEQNRLPAPPQEAEAFVARLIVTAEDLRKSADDAGELVSLASARATRPLPATPDGVDAELWQEMGRHICRLPPDKERGRLLGTAARSLAFAGDLERALEWAMDARAFFDEPDDLRFNATVLARILLEQARLAREYRERALAIALKLAGAVTDPAEFSRAILGDPGERFALDLALRAQLWAPMVVSHAGRWRPALKADGKASIYAVLRQVRSHPTELIARHAAEILRAAGEGGGATRWFELSMALSGDAPASSALRRFGEFTRWLSASEGADLAAPPGSTLNPTFEYR